MNKWTSALQVASVYVGTIVGAGFATGREIVEFFTRFELYGLIGIFIAGCLFIMFGTKIMLIAVDIEAKSFEQLNEYLFGSRLAAVMNVFLMSMLIGVCAVMMAGAEALFVEQLHFPAYFGLVFTVILALVVMSVGVKGLFAVNTFVVPMMVIFNILVMFQVMQNQSDLSFIFHNGSWDGDWKSVLSAFSYTAFNLALAQAVLVPMASEIKDRSAIKLGGIIGGGLLAFILISSHISLSTLINPAGYEIPMAVIVKEEAAGLYLIYVFIIYGEIFTSLIGNLYGLERQMKRYTSLHSMWIYGGLLLVVYCIGLVKYGTLLEFLYPLFGYISFGFLILLALKPGKSKAP